MAEPLCSLPGGDIRTSPLAAILVEALRARATGELKIDASGGTSRVYFRSGQPCGAQIFFGFKPLGQFLLELGWIDIEALDRSLAAVAGGEKQGEALVEQGYLTPERLKLGLSLHHQRHLRTLAALTEGHYAFLPSEKLPAWTGEITIPAHRAILDALSTDPGQAICARILERLPAAKGLRLRDGWRSFIGHFQLDPYEQRVVARLERAKLVSDIEQLGVVPPEKARAICASLFLMGVAIPSTPEALTPGPRDPGSPGPDLSIPSSPGPMPMPAEPGPTGSPGPVTSPGPSASPGPDADERRRRLLEAQHREIEEREQQQRALEEETRRIREQEEEAARLAREEALRRPPPEFRSDEAAARERRARLMKRALGTIPGAEVFRRAADDIGSRVTPGPLRTTPGPQGTPGPRTTPGLQGTPGPSPGPSRATVVSSTGATARPPSMSEDPARFREHVRERLAAIPREDHFARLGVPWTATREQIKQAFFAAAKLYHPDKLPAELAELGPQLKDVFAAINEAYQVLQDDERRKGYLVELRRGGGRTAGSGNDEEVRLHIAQAELALRKRDYVKAESAYRAAAKLSNRADLLAMAAWALYSDLGRGQGERARAELEQIVHDTPACAPAHYYLGVIAKLAGDIDRAAGYFREAVRVNPKHLEANQELRLIELRKKGK